MADKQYEVGLRISTTSADAGIKQSEDSLARLGAEGKKATGIFGQLKEALIGVAQAIGSAFAIYKLINLLVEGTRAAMEQARALSQLANMAQQFGQNGKEAAKAAQQLADALQSRGFQSGVILASVREMLPVTRNYAEAISAVTLAADINAKTGMRFAEALEIIKRLIAGDRGVLYAFRELHVTAKDAQGALDELRATFGGASNELDDAKQKVDSFRSAWQDLWKAIGGPIASVLAWIIDKFKLLGATWAALNLALLDFGGELQLTFHGIALLFEKFDIKHPVDSIKTALWLIHEEEVKFQEQSKARWDAWAASIEKARASIAAPGKITGPPGKPMPTVSGGELDTAKMFEDNLFKEIAALQKYYGKVRDLREKDTQAEKDALAANFRAVKDYYFKLEEVKQAEIELERKVAAAKMAAEQAAIEGAVGMLMAAFPENREIAAAQALINTYLAATRALAEGGPYLGPILAAIITAAGMAQVANIYATEPGGAMGGGGSAPGGAFGPPIRVTGAGAPATPPPSSVSSTSITTNAPATTVINVSALDTTNALRAAQRVLRPASRAYDRTLVSRGSVVVGSKRNR